MPLEIFDTRTGMKHRFDHDKDSDVLMYSCGPTVYGPSHLGHAKAYVASDVVRRYLEHLGYKVRLVINFTDVEDSITRVARERRVSVEELTESNIQTFLRDMDDLGVKRADVYPRVTGHIPEIISAIQALIGQGYAYVVDGDVFFRVRKSESLGSLSHRDPKDMIVDRLPPDGRREDNLDFALWRKPKEGHPSWPSPWGQGRPGWHVECYAMIKKHLGDRLDIHSGGLDLVYPHHESESMIGEVFVEGDWCRYWMHNGFLTIEREKMSKSLGNFVVLRDLLDEYPGEVVRLCLLKEQYRRNVEYDRDCFKRTREELGRIEEAFELANAGKGGESGNKVSKIISSSRDRFFKAMDNDFDTARAVHVLMEFAEAVHELAHFSSEEGQALAGTFEEFGRVLGVDLTKQIRLD